MTAKSDEEDSPLAGIMSKAFSELHADGVGGEADSFFELFIAKIFSVARAEGIKLEADGGKGD